MPADPFSFSPHGPWVILPNGEIKSYFAETGNMRVVIGDQYSPTVILPMAQKVGDTTTTTATVAGGYTVDVTSTAGMSVGQIFRLIDVDAQRFYDGYIVTIAVNTITVNTQFDYDFPIGSTVTFGTDDMAVDGSVTPQVFQLRLGTPRIIRTVDCTRMIFSCVTPDLVDLSKFAHLPPLTRGLLFRKCSPTDGDTNIYTVRTNAELLNIMYDWTPFAKTNPAQGVDGFGGRLTFAGQNKLGVALRTLTDENLEMVVQDDLSDITSLRVVLEGHFVDNPFLGLDKGV